MTLSKDQASQITSDIKEIKQFLLGDEFHEGFKQLTETKLQSHDIRITGNEESISKQKSDINKYINKTIIKTWTIGVSSVAAILGIAYKIFS